VESGKCLIRRFLTNYKILMAYKTLIGIEDQ